MSTRKLSYSALEHSHNQALSQAGTVAYPAIYHRAILWLTYNRFPSTYSRRDIAAAIRTLRRGHGRDFARVEYLRMVSLNPRHFVHANVSHAGCTHA